MRNINELPECPVATTISLVGNKWKLLIIRNLTKRTWRFNELQKSLNGISQKVLTDSLRQLEIEISKQAVKHQMIKDYINTLKKQEKLLTKFDGLVWGSLLESATIKDKDVIVFRFKDGTEING